MVPHCKAHNWKKFFAYVFEHVSTMAVSRSTWNMEYKIRRMLYRAWQECGKSLQITSGWKNVVLCFWTPHRGNYPGQEGRQKQSEVCAKTTEEVTFRACLCEVETEGPHRKLGLTRISLSTMTSEGLLKFAIFSVCVANKQYDTCANSLLAWILDVGFNYWVIVARWQKRFHSLSKTRVVQANVC